MKHTKKTHNKPKTRQFHIGRFCLFALLVLAGLFFFESLRKDMGLISISALGTALFDRLFEELV